jgi:hypothetical protein
MGPVPLIDQSQPRSLRSRGDGDELDESIERANLRHRGDQYGRVLVSADVGLRRGTNFGRALAGGIAELICFDHELTSDERRAVQRYLNLRHGLLGTAPAEPRLEAVACGAGQICLMWTGGDGTWSTRYEIERRLNGQGWQRLAVVEDALTWLDAVDPSTPASASYRIRALNAAGVSEWAAAQEVVLAPSDGEVALPRSGLRLWLKADAGLPLGRVNRWPDVSGRGRRRVGDVNAPTSRSPVAEAGAVRGLPAVRFDGYDDFLDLPSALMAGAKSGEAWVVLRAAGLPASENRTLWRLGGADTHYPISDGSISDGFGSATPWLGAAPGEDLGAWQVYQVSAEAGRWTSRINGRVGWTSAENTVTFSPAPTLGYAGGLNFGRSFNGQVAEILVFDRSLSEPERAAIARYLQARFGVADASGAQRLAVPGGLKIRPVGSTQVAMDWDAQVGPWAITTEIQRQETGRDFAPVASVCDGATWLDRGLTPGATYRYRLRVTGPTGASAWSDPLTVQLPSAGVGIPLASLRLWLSADGGLVPGRVGLWLDRSGRGFRAFQRVADNQPVAVRDADSGRLRVRFDAVNDSLALDPFSAGMGEGEVFAVLKARVAQPAAARILWTFGAARTLYPHDTGRVYESFGSTTAYDAGLPRVSVDRLHLYNVAARAVDWVSRLNGATSLVRTDNVVSFRADPSFGYSGHPNYGSPFDGDLAEVMVFERVLNAAEREAVGGYLATRHGFAASLAPPAPQGVTLEQVSASQVRVAWSPLVFSGGVTVELERSVGGGAYALVTEITGRSAYFDRGLTPASRVRYRLRVRTLGGLSDYSYSEEFAVGPSLIGAELPLDGVRLWLRADHGVDVQNGGVSVWRDQSGLANDAFQLEASRRPLGVSDGRGVAAVRFDGVDDALSLPDVLAGAAGGEVLAVLKASADVPASPRGLWRFGAPGVANYPDRQGLLQDDFGSPVTRPLLPAPWSLAQFRLFDVAAGQGRWTAWVNGLALHDSSENAVSFRSDPLLGHNGVTAWAGDFLELIIYDRMLSATERESAGAHLTQRYGLPDLAVPLTPTGLRAVAVFPRGVAITWNARVDGVAVRFAVERQENGGPFQAIAVVANALGCIDANVQGGRTYAYRVRALTFAGSSSPAGPVTVVLPLDTDADGLPDDWEIRAGTNPQVADAQADPDGDGLTNRQEFRLGTNPLRKATGDPAAVNLRVYQPER